MASSSPESLGAAGRNSLVSMVTLGASFPYTCAQGGVCSRGWPSDVLTRSFAPAVPTYQNMLCLLIDGLRKRLHRASWVTPPLPIPPPVTAGNVMQCFVQFVSRGISLLALITFKPDILSRGEAP